jgi:hypothetical protein
MVMESDLYLSFSIHVDRPGTALYDMVSDVTQMGDWSPTCKACWWDEGNGPWIGSWFTGRNETPERVWQTRSQVLIANRGEEFAFAVGGAQVRWGYTFVPASAGTTLTESWQLLPDGITAFKRRYGADAGSVITDRKQVARWGIQRTLAAIKAVAELSLFRSDQEPICRA